MRYVPINTTMTAKTSRFSKNQSCRSRGAIPVMSQTRAYVPKSSWSSRCSRNLVRICVVDVEIMAASSRIQDLIDPCLQIDDVRPCGPVRGPRQRGPQRSLQVDQLEARLRARVRRARRRRVEAREWREAGRQRGHQRRADEPLHLIDEGALQVAPILVDPHCPPPTAKLREGAALHVAKQVRDRVGPRLRRRLLGQARQPPVLEEQVQHRGLARADPLYEPRPLDAAQDLRIDEDRRS